MATDRTNYQLAIEVLERVGFKANWIEVNKTQLQKDNAVVEVEAL